MNTRSSSADAVDLLIFLSRERWFCAGNSIYIPSAAIRQVAAASRQYYCLLSNLQGRPIGQLAVLPAKILETLLATE
jgi:hypothetical protein